MQLVLDLGNTLQKWGIFDRNQLISMGKEEQMDYDFVVNLISTYQVTSCIISSVIEAPQLDIAYLSTQLRTIYLDHSTPIPIKNSYGNPDGLGKDRLACAVAIASLSQGIPCLSIDMGTALKFDFVNQDLEYIGGSIAPGLKMRFKALHTFTAKLPLIDFQNHHPLIGNTTEKSLLSGVINGMIAEINGMIDMYLDQFPKLNIYLTGGDLLHFENKLKSDTFAVPNLVLKGLNEILLFNEQQTSQIH
jgi:type III pantothenate kinase